LSARLKFFERFFNGINDSYIAHHFFGGVALCLLLFHPLFLAYNYLLSSFREGALFLLPGENWAQNYGTIGLLIMIITLVITFYTNLKYQIWQFTHKFLGLAYLFALLHTFLIKADLSLNNGLKTYFLVLGIAAIAAYFYRTLFVDYLVKFLRYAVKDVNLLPDKTWEIELKPLGKDIKFTAGQFGFIKFYSKELSRELHPFSFSSAPACAGRPGFPLKIAVKELGDYTGKLGSLKVGDLVLIEGPFGVFNFKNYAKKQIWIAGGIGITPFLSMLRGLSETDHDFKIDLYYSVKDENCLAFADEIQEIASANKNLNVTIWISKTAGFLTADAIKLKTQDLMERDILICGPGLMMNALKSQFFQQGVQNKKIHIEEFQLY
jgi:predicted ferric reductase